jgi:pyruvate/2-oxoglutarate/acetoin dehydrogenase E1 component
VFWVVTWVTGCVLNVSSFSFISSLVVHVFFVAIVVLEYSKLFLQNRLLRNFFGFPNLWEHHLKVGQQDMVPLKDGITLNSSEMVNQVMREGSDITLVGWGAQLTILEQACTEAAKVVDTKP